MFPMMQIELPSVVRVCLTVFALGVVAGCQSSLTGNEGNLTFYYPTDDQLDFNKPIAIGAKLDLTVFTTGAHAKVELTAVTSDKPQILDSKGFLGNAFTLEGKSDGSAAISVKAKKADGTTTQDTINMLARKPEVIDIAHSCSAGPVGYYLTDKTIFLPYDLHMKNSQSVIGYGYHALTMVPKDGLAWDQIHKAQWAYVYKTAKLPGDVTLTSVLEPTRSWTVRLVDEGMIDGGTLTPVTNKTLDVLANVPAFVLARPTIGGQLLCQPDVTYSAVSKTPEVCTVAPTAAKLQATKELVESRSWLTVTGKTSGVCEFEVTWTKGNKGQGVKVPLKVNVLKVLKP